MARLEQIPESLLARLWKERASREESFRAGDGRRFRVIYPGRLGTTGGPDFRDAVLEQEGLRLVRGAVEVHVRQRDWDAHGHRNDPRYNGVVLHVAGGTNRSATTLHSGSRVPVVSIERLLEGGPAAEVGPGLGSLLKPHGYLPPKNLHDMGTLLPLLNSYAQPKGDAALEAISLDLFRLCPHLQDNEITREMREQLLPQVGSPGAAGARRRNGGNQGEALVFNARRQQGLLHLHRLITSPAKSAGVGV